MMDDLHGTISSENIPCPESPSLSFFVSQAVIIPLANKKKLCCILRFKTTSKLTAY